LAKSGFVYYVKLNFLDKVIEDGVPYKKKIPVEARFFAHVQTGPGAHPVSCAMGTGSLLGVKRPGRGADPPPPPSALVANVLSDTATTRWGRRGRV
jgi:hypothetical protein